MNVRTATRATVSLLDPDPATIFAADIATHLAKQCRYAGACRGHYSVAQHSVLVSLIVDRGDPELALAGLLHDGHEAYTGDIIKPIKQLLGAEIGALEARLDRAIGLAFGVTGLDRAEVKAADLWMLRAEMADLMGGVIPGAPAPPAWFTPARMIAGIVPLPAEQAAPMFLDRLFELTAARKAARTACHA
jgi:hypothetical protein